jgi:branched-chain amino acid aminotransferase
MKENEFIWQNGSLVKWKDAKVHVLTHALHYGSSVFEGIRVYKTDKGGTFFRLNDHLKRLYNSAKIYHINIPFTIEILKDACKEVVNRNNLNNGAYVRPVAFKGYGEMGVAGMMDAPAECAIAAWEWGTYLGDKALENGVDVCVSSWNRVAPNTIPTLAKAGGNYLSSSLITMEARKNGYSEGIALNTEGYVSEGAGENIFIALDGELYTPPLSSAILAGLTRDTVLKIADKLGLKVSQESIPREILYIADEIFLTGTAVEITPVKSVDGYQVGNGQRGPMTKKVQDEFFGLFNGATVDNYDWLELI